MVCGQIPVSDLKVVLQDSQVTADLRGTEELYSYFTLHQILCVQIKYEIYGACNTHRGEKYTLNLYPET
jgi:hypothetical protein